jgi:hypothetical protein
MTARTIRQWAVARPRWRSLNGPCWLSLGSGLRRGSLRRARTKTVFSGYSYLSLLYCSLYPSPAFSLGTISILFGVSNRLPNISSLRVGYPSRRGRARMTLNRIQLGESDMSECLTRTRARAGRVCEKDHPILWEGSVLCFGHVQAKLLE